MSDAPLTADVVRRLRLAYASAPARTSSGTCEDPEQLWAAVRGTLDGARVGQLLDHAAECAACDRAFQLARELHRQLPDAGAPAQVPVRAPPRWMRRPALAGVLLASAAAAIAVISLRRESPPAEPVLREPTSRAIVSLAGTEHQPREQVVLRWSSGPRGTLYDLWVTTPALREIYRAAQLEVPEVRVPASALEGLQAGEEILWRVEARFPDGGRAASPAFRTRLE